MKWKLLDDIHQLLRTIFAALKRKIIILPGSDHHLAEFVYGVLDVMF